jgi:pilus assembly protein Flp/PilA
MTRKLIVQKFGLFLGNHEPKEDSARGSKVSGLLNKFVNDEGGATAIEYALLAAIVGVGIITVLGSVRTGLVSEFATTATALADANSK